MAKYPTITRDQYQAMLKSGYEFRGAGLYEPQHNPKAKFVFINLGPAAPSVFKRIMKEPVK